LYLRKIIIKQYLPIYLIYNLVICIR
jgi:hypothetical protein